MLRKARQCRDAQLGLLCPECKLIEWPYFVPHHKDDARNVLHKWARFELLPDKTPGQSACPMCDLLIISGLARVTNNPEIIYACSAPRVFLSDEANEALASHLTVSDVTQWGTILISSAIGVELNAVFGILHPGSHRQKYAPRIIDPSSINYDVIRGCIQRCSVHPNRQCIPTGGSVFQVSRL